jgi:acetyl esterase
LPRAAALLYGVYSADDDTPSYRAYGGGDYVISKSLLGWAWDQYVPHRSRRTDPLAAPLHADLEGLSPIFVSAAEFDPLRDDSERLVARLAQSGVDVDYRFLRGMCHASTMMGRLLPAASTQLAQVGEFLRARTA